MNDKALIAQRADIPQHRASGGPDLRRQVSDAVRIPVFVMIIATFTTCTELLMKAYTYELYQILGIFIPLIVTNCVILGRAEAFASKQPVPAALFDGVLMRLGFALVLVAIGGIREALGSGTLLANMQLLFGPPRLPGRSIYSATARGCYWPSSPRGPSWCWAF